MTDLTLVADGESIVPYTCWGTKSKVTLRVKSVLKFHDVVHGAKPLATAETSWVNYIFENEEGEPFRSGFAVPKASC